MISLTSFFLFLLQLSSQESEITRLQTSAHKQHQLELALHRSSETIEFLKQDKCETIALLQEQYHDRLVTKDTEISHLNTQVTELNEQLTGLLEQLSRRSSCYRQLSFTVTADSVGEATDDNQQPQRPSKKRLRPRYSTCSREGLSCRRSSW